MANPFLFGDAPSEPQNPFLLNDVPASSEPANPFLMGGTSAMPMHQQTQNFGAQDMGGNPFASYGAPMYADPSSQYYYQQGAQQSFVQPQQAFTHPQQSFAGQYGQYSQVNELIINSILVRKLIGHSTLKVATESFTQPPAQTTFATAAAHQPPAPALTGVAAFGIEEPEPAPQFVPDEKTSDLPPPPGKAF
jgi:hypothetical protein